jgi:hypothetical protein
MLQNIGYLAVKNMALNKEILGGKADINSN